MPGRWRSRAAWNGRAGPSTGSTAALAVCSTCRIWWEDWASAGRCTASSARARWRRFSTRPPRFAGRWWKRRPGWAGSRRGGSGRRSSSSRTRQNLVAHGRHRTRGQERPPAPAPAGGRSGPLRGGQGGVGSGQEPLLAGPGRLRARGGRPDRGRIAGGRASAGRHRERACRAAPGEGDRGGQVRLRAPGEGAGGRHVPPLGRRGRADTGQSHFASPAGRPDRGGPGPRPQAPGDGASAMWTHWGGEWPR